MDLMYMTPSEMDLMYMTPSELDAFNLERGLARILAGGGWEGEGRGRKGGGGERERGDSQDAALVMLNNLGMSVVVGLFPWCPRSRFQLPQCLSLLFLP